MEVKDQRRTNREREFSNKEGSNGKDSTHEIGSNKIICPAL